ncbi:unnamed protein product [Amoebophrya sp. A25]|nr:unnamed protein product [Amoebophrya sp. A25]|eukprot:GSA25T00000620001.1
MTVIEMETTTGRNGEKDDSPQKVLQSTPSTMPVACPDPTAAETTDSRSAPKKQAKCGWSRRRAARQQVVYNLRNKPAAVIRRDLQMLEKIELLYDMDTSNNSAFGLVKLSKIELDKPLFPVPCMEMSDEEREEVLRAIGSSDWSEQKSDEHGYGGSRNLVEQNLNLLSPAGLLEEDLEQPAIQFLGDRSYKLALSMEIATKKPKRERIFRRNHYLGLRSLLMLTNFEKGSAPSRSRMTLLSLAIIHQRDAAAAALLHAGALPLIFPICKEDEEDLEDTLALLIKFEPAYLVWVLRHVFWLACQDDEYRCVEDDLRKNDTRNHDTDRREQHFDECEPPNAPSNSRLRSRARAMDDLRCPYEDCKRPFSEYAFWDTFRKGYEHCTSAHEKRNPVLRCPVCCRDTERIHLKALGLAQRFDTAAGGSRPFISKALNENGQNFYELGRLTSSDGTSEQEDEEKQWDDWRKAVAWYVHDHCSWDGDIHIQGQQTDTIQSFSLMPSSPAVIGTIADRSCARFLALPGALSLTVADKLEIKTGRAKNGNADEEETKAPKQGKAKSKNADKMKKTGKPTQFCGLPLHEIKRLFLGSSRKQRLAELVKALKTGDILRLACVVEAGVDLSLSTVDSYANHSALYLALRRVLAEEPDVESADDPTAKAHHLRWCERQTFFRSSFLFVLRFCGLAEIGRLENKLQHSTEDPSRPQQRGKAKKQHNQDQSRSNSWASRICESKVHCIAACLSAMRRGQTGGTSARHLIHRLHHQSVPEDEENALEKDCDTGSLDRILRKARGDGSISIWDAAKFATAPSSEVPDATCLVVVVPSCEDFRRLQSSLVTSDSTEKDMIGRSVSSSTLAHTPDEREDTYEHGTAKAQHEVIPIVTGYETHTTARVCILTNLQLLKPRAQEVDGGEVSCRVLLPLEVRNLPGRPSWEKKRDSLRLKQSHIQCEDFPRSYSTLENGAFVVDDAFSASFLAFLRCIFWQLPWMTDDDLTEDFVFSQEQPKQKSVVARQPSKKALTDVEGERDEAPNSTSSSESKNLSSSSKSPEPTRTKAEDVSFTPSTATPSTSSSSRDRDASTPSTPRASPSSLSSTKNTTETVARSSTTSTSMPAVATTSPKMMNKPSDESKGVLFAKTACNRRKYFADPGGYVREALRAAIFAAAPTLLQKEGAIENLLTEAEHQDVVQDERTTEQRLRYRRCQENLAIPEQNGFLSGQGTATSNSRTSIRSNDITAAKSKETEKGNFCLRDVVFYPDMRFLYYDKPSSAVPPHTDLCRTDDEGRTSTHTFILYLNETGGNVATEAEGENGSDETLLSTDQQTSATPTAPLSQLATVIDKTTAAHKSGSGDDESSSSVCGGDTSLLNALPGPKNDYTVEITHKVSPLPGRLFLFPHSCPHQADPVLKPPKLLLRGEVKLCFASTEDNQ